MPSIHAVCLRATKTGRTDLGYFARKLRDTYADLRRHVRDLPFGQNTPDVPDLEVAVFALMALDSDSKADAAAFTAKAAVKAPAAIAEGLALCARASAASDPAPPQPAAKPTRVTVLPIAAGSYWG